MKSYKIVCYITFLLVFLSGCTQEKAFTPSFTISPTPTPRPVESETSLPANTLFSQTMIRRCAKILSDSEMGTQPGKVIIDYQASGGGGTYFLDLPSHIRTLISQSTLNEIVTPNGNLLAFTDVDFHSIKIMNSDGQQIAAIQDPNELLTPVKWLDNDRLLLDKKQISSDNGTRLLPSLVIYNPITGDEQELFADYPNIYPYAGELRWEFMNYFIPNPQLSFVIYPINANGGPLVLWDTNKHQEVTQIEAGLMEPQFSPFGDQLVVTIYQGPLLHNNGTDLFVIRTDGSSKRLTYFSMDNYAIQKYYRWSPDAKQIAFMVKIGDKVTDEYQLALISVDSQQVINYCVGGEPPIWSPDSKFLLFDQGNSGSGSDSPVYVLRIEDGAMWKIAEHAYAEGWMIASEYNFSTP
jgi:hypothetical protein